MRTTMMLRTVAILIAGSLPVSVGPANAKDEEPVKIPETVQIEDPAGDANYLNDQGFGGLAGVVPEAGDNVTGQDATAAGDLLKVWFRADATKISVAVQTEAPPPSTEARFFRVSTDPNGEGRTCLSFEAWTPGLGNDEADPAAQVSDSCSTAFVVPAEVEILDGPDGTGVIVISAQRSDHDSFSEGSVLATPIAHTRHYVNGLTVVQADDTKVGSDYIVTTEEKPKKHPRNKKKCKCRHHKCKRRR